MKKLQPVRGTKDLIKGEADIYRNIDLGFEITALDYGFWELRTPIIEDSEVFKKTLGTTSDIIKKETYTFKDRSNNQITLRPEGTAPIVRSFINNYLHEPLPQKFFYQGPMFRYDRPQRGRLRQFDQLGVEIIGEKSIAAELELISLALEFLVIKCEIKFSNFKIHVNSLGDEESRKKYSIELKNFFQDHKKKLTSESIERLKKNPLRILDTKNENEKELIKKAPKLKNFLNNESIDIFEEFKKGCKELNISIFIDDNLVRGLDYYNNICYEFKVAHPKLKQFLGSQDTFLAGGRYDGLIKKMGGPDYSGCGFAAGTERIISMLGGVEKINKINETKKPLNTYIAVIVIGKVNIIEGSKIIKKIREKIMNLKIDEKSMSIGETIFTNNLSKGISRVYKSDFAIIVGEEEIIKKELTVKNLADRTQKKMKLEEVLKNPKKLIDH